MLRLLVFLTALFAAQAALARPEPTQMIVHAPRDGFLNLRAGPSTDYYVIRKMREGSSVIVLARPGKWYKVRHQSGAVGWAHSKFLRPVRDTTHETGDRTRFWVNAPKHGTLNLREHASPRARIVLRMRQGSEVEALGRRGDWRLVRHKATGKIGWAHADYLSHRPVALPYVVPGHGGHKGGHKGGRKLAPWERIVRHCSDRTGDAFQACLIRGFARLEHGGGRYTGW